MKNHRIRPFVIGVLVGIALFLALNVLVWINPGRADARVFGFPLTMHVTGFVNSYEYEQFYIGNIVGNIILIPLSSLGLGVVFQYCADWSQKQTNEKTHS